MELLGDKLQAARKIQGLTLEQVANRTRIQDSYLRALEEGSFEQLPARVFTKGFVRSYARLLDLDEEECLRLFAECSDAFYKKEAAGRKLPLLKEGEPTGRTSRVMVVLLVGGILLLGVRVLLQQKSLSTSVSSHFSQQPVDLLDRSLSEPEQPDHTNESAEDRLPASTQRHVDASGSADTESVPTTMDVAGIPVESPVDDRASEPSLLPSDPAPIASTTTESDDKPLILEVRTLEMTWIVVRSDENEPREALLREGEILQWRARERFLLTLGNAGGVEVRLNGQLRGPFGETGVVVRDVELRPQPPILAP